MGCICRLKSNGRKRRAFAARGSRFFREHFPRAHGWAFYPDAHEGGPADAIVDDALNPGVMINRVKLMSRTEVKDPAASAIPTVPPAKDLATLKPRNEHLLIRHRNAKRFTVHFRLLGVFELVATALVAMLHPLGRPIGIALGCVGLVLGLVSARSSPANGLVTMGLNGFVIYALASSGPAFRRE